MYLSKVRSLYFSGCLWFISAYVLFVNYFLFHQTVCFFNWIVSYFSGHGPFWPTIRLFSHFECSTVFYNCLNHLHLNFGGYNVVVSKYVLSLNLVFFLILILYFCPPRSHCNSRYFRDQIVCVWSIFIHDHLSMKQRISLYFYLKLW